jgi:asparagine synthase (glutamine-hydrolysing)
MGFGAPLGSWLRGVLRPWADDLLAPNRLHRRGLWNVERITERWREHKAGRQQWHYPLWVVLMLEAWLEEWSA